MVKGTRNMTGVLQNKISFIFEPENFFFSHLYLLLGNSCPKLLFLMLRHPCLFGLGVLPNYRVSPNGAGDRLGTGSVVGISYFTRM